MVRKRCVPYWIRLRDGQDERPPDATCGQHTVRPLHLELWGPVWTLTAWCDLGFDLRVFPVDWIEHLERQRTAFPEKVANPIGTILRTVSAPGPSHEHSHRRHEKPRTSYGADAGGNRCSL
ncbi:WYL domain-containing protein [Mesorhizobium sp. M0047]|uniref:WYL domain-containing protein n=1 Tax=Mesorhizobium sp. M0047 TaxID=2956859 RepID=UPI00333D62FD